VTSPDNQTAAFFSAFDHLPTGEQRHLYAALEEIRKRARYATSNYTPYFKQELFHAAGATFRERLLRAGNQNGKTFAGGMEYSYHCTGLYPDWWQGARISKADPVIWASSDTGETTRDNPQRALLGMVGDFGTGSIPEHCILKMKPARGVVDLMDYVKVQHHDKDGNPDGVTTLRFKYYEQGRQRWQGPPVDAIWFDEEPPQAIYSEGLARTIATGGFAALTFTPLLGMSEVVRSFLKDPGEDKHDTNMTIDDALHIPEEQRRRVIASFKEHEREARSKGIPILGSGRIFPVSEASIKYEAQELPNGPGQFPHYFAHIGALDFGWDHPTAAVHLVWDRDNDVVYVAKAYKRRQASVLEHCGALRVWGDWLPYAWPHDGLAADKGSGETLASQYEGHGLNMLSERATFEDGGFGVEAGLMEMLDRMQTGRLKVASHLEEWFDEFRIYHRENGKVVKEVDDLISATRYGIMMLREAVPEGGEDYSLQLDYSDLDRATI
jgi:phage terminase large subunit-like protein